MDNLAFILYELCRRTGPGKEPVTLSTSRLGSMLGVSQQTASRYLQELEAAGLVSRERSPGGYVIRVTDAGYLKLEGMYADLKRLIDPEGAMKIEGKISSGIGEGAYYVKEYAPAIVKKLGIQPFPGTLNVRMERGPDPFAIKEGFEIIEGFERKGRSFGPIRYAPVTVSVPGKKQRSEECFLIIPARTHHQGILEIISPRNLRERLALSDGDAVEIELR